MRRETRLTPQGGGNKNDTKCKFTFLQKHLHFRAMRKNGFANIHISQISW